MHVTTRRKLTTGLLLAAWAITMGALAEGARAASIVYVKGGNVWLASPDGTQGYEVTFGGGWSSPSQADDGTIMALNGGRTYRLSPAGRQLGAPVPTVFSGAAPGSSHGPFGARISPDGSSQAYWGDVYTSYDDFGCGCTLFRWEAFTRWGSASTFSEPNQTRGQELYGEPAWIDSGHLLLSDIGGVFSKQVAVYATGGGDNSMTQWFSDPDPSVKQLQFGAVTRAGDRLAFVATTASQQDQIRLYAANGPVPAAPTAKCALGGAAGGQFSYPSFSPDGGTLAWQDADGVHVAPVSNLDDCSTITDRLLLPGGSEPYFGPADVTMANAPAPPAGGNGGPGAGGGGGQGTTGAGNPAGGGTHRTGGSSPKHRPKHRRRPAHRHRPSRHGRHH